MHLNDAGADVVVFNQLADVQGSHELRVVVVDIFDDDQQWAVRRHPRFTAVRARHRHVVRVVALAIQRRRRYQRKLRVV